MAIERITAPYEILLRFNFDPAFGPLGIFRGAHYIEGEALMEDGKVLSYTPGQALPLADAPDVSEYLGRQFAQVEAAYAAATAASAALTAENIALTAELARVSAELAQVPAAIEPELAS